MRKRNFPQGWPLYYNSSNDKWKDDIYLSILFTHFWGMLTDSKRSQALKGSFSVLIDNVGHSLSFKLAAGGRDILIKKPLECNFFDKCHS